MTRVVEVDPTTCARARNSWKNGGAGMILSSIHIYIGEVGVSLPGLF
jgi:hypothetical protein